MQNTRFYMIQNYEGQLKSSQISCPLKITSFLPTLNLLSESISFLKQAVHSQPNLCRTAWPKLRGEKTTNQQDNNCNPCFATALLFGRLGCSFFTFQACCNPTKKLSDKGNLQSSWAQGAAFHLAWNSPIQIPFANAFTWFCHINLSSLQGQEGSAAKGPALLLIQQAKTVMPQYHCSFSGSRSQTLRGPQQPLCWMNSTEV